MEARRSKVQPGEVVGYVDQDALGTLKLSRTQYAQLWGDPFFRSVPLYLAPPEPSHKFEPWMAAHLLAIAEHDGHPHLHKIADAIEDILKGGTDET